MDFILNPFVTVLTFLYSILGHNMVLAIVVFTILVRLLTYPLTAQQMKSTKAMQAMQPELKKLQEKYKGDREKLAQAQMAMYKEYGVNPAAGCLPLFIQLPLFLALYQAINFALASTPTQLLDLSGRLLIPGLDSVIPLDSNFFGLNLTQPPNMAGGGLSAIVGIAAVALVVVTTWLQFKVTSPAPAPSEDGKPNQAQAMTQSMGTIMPLMYGFFALSFSIGLSIYFIAGNVIGIVQYALMGRANFSNIFGGNKPKTTTQPAQVSGKAKRRN